MSKKGICEVIIEKKVFDSCQVIQARSHMMMKGGIPSLKAATRDEILRTGAMVFDHRAWN